LQWAHPTKTFPAMVLIFEPLFLVGGILFGLAA
jgi:hypothetical protein